MIETSAAPKRPVIVWDLVLTIGLLVLMAGTAILASFLSFFLAFAGDPCGSGITCDYDRMGTGMLVAMIGPLAVGGALSVAPIPVVLALMGLSIAGVGIFAPLILKR